LPAKDKRAPESMAQAVRAAGPRGRTTGQSRKCGPLPGTHSARLLVPGWPWNQVQRNSPAAGQACRVAELLTDCVFRTTPGFARCGRPKALGYPAAPGGQPSLEASNGEWCEGGSAAKRVAAPTWLLHASPVACCPTSAPEQPFPTSARPLTPPPGRRAAPEPLPSCSEAHATRYIGPGYPNEVPTRRVCCRTRLSLWGCAKPPPSSSPRSQHCARASPGGLLGVIARRPQARPSSCRPRH